jgi:hypothetical protein
LGLLVPLVLGVSLLLLGVLLWCIRYVKLRIAPRSS